jgi:hypothetical protein
MTQAAIEKRSAQAEFVGLERELIDFKRNLLEEYQRSKKIKHPRDLGNEREAILRRFLTLSGLIPAKYGVSGVSARVVSRNGQISRELDIVFFNKTEAILLMRFEALEYYPVESVYGVIQVKSRLTTGKLRDALENIASYKRLEQAPFAAVGDLASTFQTPLEKGFGLIFAYESNMKWLEISEAMKEWARAWPSTTWPNAVIVLGEGFLGYRRGNRLVVRSNELESFAEPPEIFGWPDRDDAGLFSFYKMVMDLLSHSSAGAPPIEGYYRLPLTAGQLSYQFSWGFFGELGKCDSHGQYLRQITQDSLSRIIATVEHEPSINWIRAIDLAYGKPGDQEEAYRRQPGEVKIYNPARLPLSDVLVAGNSLSFDSIETRGMTVLLPHFYVARDNLISGCPKCSRRQRPAAPPMPKVD